MSKHALLRGSAIAAILVLAGAEVASAQSFLANRGLGLAVEPRSTRSSSLGGVSLGLPGSEISWANPAGAIGMPAAGLSVSFQFDDISGQYAGADVAATAARFPLLMAAFPFGSRWVLTAGLGGYLDQNWALERADTLIINNDTTPLVDRITSEGGVGRFRVGAGYRLIERLSVAVGMDVYTGGVRRFSGRVLQGQNQQEEACCSARWDYSGVGAMASIDWNPHEAVSVSLGASAGGTLETEPRDSVSAARSYPIPASVDAGASARIASSLLVAVGGDWTRWSSLNDALIDQGGAQDTWSVQGGLEWDALRVGSRTIPLRLGGRTGGLPFRAPGTTGDEWGTEHAITGGIGLGLGNGQTVTDIGLERGTRTGGSGVDESFWRILLSVSVLGL